MKLLFATAAPPRFSPFYTGEKRFPLGISFLAATARKLGWDVELVDNYAKPTDFIRKGELEKRKVDVFGVSANTICWENGLKMLRQAQKRRRSGKWRGKIIVGGPHASVAPETIPDFVDHIVIGEGEKAIVEILENSNPSRILRSDLVKDLDTLPFPVWDIFDHDLYDLTYPWLPGEKVFTLNTSRGCPFGCTFCSVREIWGNSYRAMSAQRTLAEVERVVADFGVKGVYFREDHFTLNRKRMVEFSELMIKSPLDVKWACEARADSLTDETMKIIARAGCRWLYVGVESGNQRLLDLMEKGETLDDFRAMFAAARKYGIKTYASFIVGLPTETPEERLNTVRFAKEIRADSASFNVFVGLPNTPLTKYALANHMHTYIDQRGLVYMKNHDRMVKTFYGNWPFYKVPRQTWAKLARFYIGKAKRKFLP